MLAPQDGREESAPQLGWPPCLRVQAGATDASGVCVGNEPSRSGEVSRTKHRFAWGGQCDLQSREAARRAAWLVYCAFPWDAEHRPV